MSANEKADGSTLSREIILRALQTLSAQEALELVGQYYPANRIPLKTQYLVEGLFEEGKV